MPPGERRRSPRQAMRPNPTTTTRKKNEMRMGPSVDSEKACTELMTPERVRKVPENGEGEGGDRKRQVPDAHEPAAFLHQDRVEVGRPAQPGEEGGVLDRIPAPEASPPEYLVGPPGAEHDPDGEGGKGEQGPATALDLPSIADPASGEHADGEGEGHGEPDEADVEKGWMDGHQRVVLEQRVGPEPGRDVRRGDERVGGPHHHPEEERGDHVEHQGGPSDDRVGDESPVAPDEDDGEDGEDQAPQEDRSGQGGPQAGEGVQQRGHLAVVLRHEDDGEVVRDEGVLHGDRGQHRADEHDRREEATVEHAQGGTDPVAEAR